MAENRIPDKEIIKALMCFSFWDEGCNKCPHLKHCNKTKRFLTIIDTIDALALINRQQAEIENITEKFNCQQTVYADLSKIIKDKNAEIERLKENNKAIMQTIAGVHTEAIKEFAERLKEKQFCFGSLKGVELVSIYAVEIKDIDNLVKEMVGEQE